MPILSDPLRAVSVTLLKARATDELEQRLVADLQRLACAPRPALAQRPSSCAAFSFSTSGRTSSLIGSRSKSASQRSGVISG